MEALLKIKFYLEISKIVSTLSYCNNKKVGAIIVNNNNIISYGYNGTPSGFENICEINGITKPEVLHAESNAITKCAKSFSSTYGSIMYCTLSPCYECAKLIIQSGIIAVYYLEEYRNIDGLNLLKKANIYYEKIQ